MCVCCLQGSSSVDPLTTDLVLNKRIAKGIFIERVESVLISRLLEQVCRLRCITFGSGGNCIATAMQVLQSQILHEGCAKLIDHR